jgi:hypothetical protein
MAAASVGKVIPVSAPPRVHALLRAAADQQAPIVHRGRDAVYVEIARQCVGVVGVRATAVPCALRSRAPRLDVESAHLRRGVLHLNGEPLVVGRIVDVRVPRIGAATAAAPTLTPTDVEQMLGRGDGLTPYGDDMICGWLAVHRAAELVTPDIDAAVRAGMKRTTLLSAALLDCALHGEVIPEFATYLAALHTPAEADRALALTDVGHSSGRGLLQGARLALSGLEFAEVAA